MRVGLKSVESRYMAKRLRQWWQRDAAWQSRRLVPVIPEVWKCSTWRSVFVKMVLCFLALEQRWNSGNARSWEMQNLPEHVLIYEWLLHHLLCWNRSDPLLRNFWGFNLSAHSATLDRYLFFKVMMNVVSCKSLVSTDLLASLTLIDPLSVVSGKSCPSMSPIS
jgi:hypothetical protein